VVEWSACGTTQLSPPIYEDIFGFLILCVGFDTVPAVGAGVRLQRTPATQPTGFGLHLAQEIDEIDIARRMAEICQ